MRKEGEKGEILMEIKELNVNLNTENLTLDLGKLSKEDLAFLVEKMSQEIERKNRIKKLCDLSKGDVFKIENIPQRFMFMDDYIVDGKLGRYFENGGILVIALDPIKTMTCPAPKKDYYSFEETNVNAALNNWAEKYDIESLYLRKFSLDPNNITDVFFGHDIDKNYCRWLKESFKDHFYKDFKIKKFGCPDFKLAFAYADFFKKYFEKASQDSIFLYTTNYKGVMKLTSDLNFSLADLESPKAKNVKSSICPIMVLPENTTVELLNTEK